MGVTFTHLHVASSYSMHHGVNAPERLIDAARAHGAEALAMTDRDGLYGAVAFVRACGERGMQPIVGADLRVSDRGRVTVLAMRDGGYGQLCRAVSAAHADELELDWFAGHDRLVVLLGPESDVGLAVADRRLADARAALDEWRRVLREPRIEVVCHLAEPGQPESVTWASRMLALAEEAGLRAVLTNAVRYASPDDAAIADVLDAASAHARLDDVELALTGQSWLKPPAEMEAIARMIAGVGDHAPNAANELLAETERTAAACLLDAAGDLGIGTPVMPERELLDIGPGADPQQALVELARTGLTRKYGAGSAKTLKIAEQRLDHELRTVERLGFAPYFLTVRRVTEIIRKMNVRLQARGSGVGSVLNYVLGTSGVEPLGEGLLWERFLSGSRRTLPDIDLDVESTARHDIYRQLFHDFGEDRITLMSMASTYGARGAVRDAGAALGLDPDQIDSIAKSFWRFPAGRIREALERKPELRDFAEAMRESPRLELLVDVTERLDGIQRHASVHPCGVILSDATLLDRTPVETSGIGLPMSQYGKHDMDPMGLIKIDVLGVRMQSSMACTLREIKRTTGADELIDLDAVPRDDPAVYEMLRTTKTMGVFQLESPGQMQLIGKLQPETFDDLTLEISLFRPGAMKHDMVTHYLRARHQEVAPDYIHPRLRPILQETKGVVVYHEQVMRIMDALTDCGLGEADDLRRRLKVRHEVQGVRDFIYEGARKKGIPERVVDRLWPTIESFGSFGFCKAHGASFALPTYQSAWLKAHYPVEHLAGLFTHQPGMWGQDVLASEARRLGVELLPVDVLRSDLEWRVERPKALRAALTEVAGLSEAERERIVHRREEQPYTSFADFHARTRLTRRSLTTLAKIGALDGFIGDDPARRHELLVHLASLRASRTRVADTQLSFDLDLPVPSLPGARSPEIAGRTQSDLEFLSLGFSTRVHRMARFHALFERLGVTPASRLLGMRAGEEVLVAGIRRATNTPPMKSGKRTVFVTLDDGTDLSHLVIFEDAQPTVGARTFRTKYLLARGVTQRVGARTVSVIVDAAWDLAELSMLELAEVQRLVRGEETADAALFDSERARAAARTSEAVPEAAVVTPLPMLLSAQATAGTPASA